MPCVRRSCQLMASMCVFPLLPVTLTEEPFKSPSRLTPPKVATLALLAFAFLVLLLLSLVTFARPLKLKLQFQPRGVNFFSFFFTHRRSILHPIRLGFFLTFYSSPCFLLPILLSVMCLFKHYFTFVVSFIHFSPLSFTRFP